MILYIILTYLIMFGVTIDNYDKPEDISREGWLILILSPITLPILIGMWFNK